MYTIYLDFQGTVVEIDENPSYYISRMNFGCMQIIHKLQLAGHKIVLNTSYSTSPEKLKKILEYLNLNPRYEIQPITEVAKDKLYPSKWDWEEIHKYKQIFIDDHAYNIPLKKCCMSDYMMVDWSKLNEQFIEHKIYEV